VRISPQALIPLPVTSFGCPFVQPFTTEFDLIVDGRGSGDVFVNQVAFRFVDGTSFGSSLLFSAGDLRARFGQTTVLAGSTRLFRFTPQFGCGSFRPRSLLTDIVLIDRLGARQQMSLSAPIR
jgi:hypothetical protein